MIFFSTGLSWFHNLIHKFERLTHIDINIFLYHLKKNYVHFQKMVFFSFNLSFFNYSSYVFFYIENYENIFIGYNFFFNLFVRE
jgi:hypothetical protein